MFKDGNDLVVKMDLTSYFYPRSQKVVGVAAVYVDGIVTVRIPTAAEANIITIT
jgi:hypothetical protein